MTTTTNTNTNTNTLAPTLVLGATGKTGRRVADRLRAAGHPTRLGTRTGTPPFDWDDQATWGPALNGVRAVYISYPSDLAFPGAPETVRALIETAVDHGADRFVLLATRGDEERQRVARAVPNSGADVTVLQCAWFMQNFSEGFLLDSVLSGELAFPGGEAREPWIDVDDIADVAVAALTQDGHAGATYQLTSPRSYTLADVAEELSVALGRRIPYVEVTAQEYESMAAGQGVPPEFVEFMTFLFADVLGTNDTVSGDVQRVLGRAPRDFAQFARNAATSSVWSAAAAELRA